MSDKIKQVIVARKDLKMSAGKLAAQVAHAAIAAYEVADKDMVDAWKRAGVTKVVLECKSEKDLLSVYKRAISDYLPTSLICDEGRTEVEPGTITCVGIGPDKASDIDKITGSLPLYGKDVK